MMLTRSLMIVTLAGGSLWAQTPPKSQAPAPAPAKTPATATATNATTTSGTAKTPTPPPAASKQPAPAPKPTATAAKPVDAKSASVAGKGMAPQTTAAKPVEHSKVSHAPMIVEKAPAPKPVMAEKPKVAAKPAEKKPMPKAESAEVVAKPASAKEQETSTRVSTAAGRRDPFVSPIVRATAGPGGPICETGKRCLMVDQISLKGIVKSPNGYIAVVENPLKRAYFLRENDPIFNGSVVKITGDSVVFRELTTDKLGKQSTREVVKKVNAPVV